MRVGWNGVRAAAVGLYSSVITMMHGPTNIRIADIFGLFIRVNSERVS